MSQVRISDVIAIFAVKQRCYRAAIAYGEGEYLFACDVALRIGFPPSGKQVISSALVLQHEDWLEDVIEVRVCIEWLDTRHFDHGRACYSSHNARLLL